MNDERRVYQRLTLAAPLDGWFGDYPVRLVDVSANGAQIEHDEPIPDDANGLLRFWWHGAEVEIVARTARVIHTDRMGLQFVEENDTLRTLLAAADASLTRALEANARGDRAANVFGDETLTSAWHRPIRGYVCWIYDGNGWRSRFTRDPDQPADGFTVSAAEPDEQVDMLRRTYEEGDDDARRLTRVFAKLSVAGTS